MRAAGALVKGAQRVGLLKAWEGSFLSGMQQYSETFLGKEPFLSPGVPLTPKDPDGTPPRRFQYTPGYNYAIQPRSTESITFAQLRAVSDYTLIRVIIEHVKDLLKSHEWDIVAADKGKGESYEGDIKACVEFWEKPDQRNTWDEWLGQVIEEIVSIDALTLYRHKTRGGKLWALEVIDGSSIKPVIDERGMEPLPPVPAYQQFLYGIPKTAYTQDEIIYRPKNRRANKYYGFGPVEQCIITINQGMRRELQQLAQFTDGNIPAGVCGVPKEWKPEEILAWQKYWDDVLVGDVQNRSRIRFVPEGGQIQKFKEDELYNSKNSFDEWMARIFCFTFGISPIPFISMTNRSVAEELGDVEAEGGVAVLKMFIERLINEVIDHDLLMPHLQFTWITDRGRLMAKKVDRNVRYLGAGILQLDEIREDEGLEPIGLPPGIITASGFVPFPEVGADGRIIEPEPPPLMPGQAPNDEDEEEEDKAGEEEERVPQAKAKKALAKARIAELDQWERWALARAREGKLAKSSFDCEFIGDEEADIVRLELSEIQKYNENHDPETGQFDFADGGGGGGGGGHESESSKPDRALSEPGERIPQRPKDYDPVPEMTGDKIEDKSRARGLLSVQRDMTLEYEGAIRNRDRIGAVRAHGKITDQMKVIRDYEDRYMKAHPEDISHAESVEREQRDILRRAKERISMIGKVVYAGDLEKSSVNIPEEIKRVFAGRRNVPPPLKLSPPTAGEMAHVKGDLKGKLRAVMAEEAARAVQG